ncbi:YjbH domain-containing protein [Idiomarina seosinensis]|uniref:YjbH domain-containing protein n=1 Tax=Idiomarina seosinensis TaxID=281739 RepID=A0A432ZGA8_9GAMM|nr:YjbH domain-containing protein [Idiomarina seosinensis]RUO76944.1 YjbH domain-containing protein [Idiomarina seosinensis]
MKYCKTLVPTLVASVVALAASSQSASAQEISDALYHQPTQSDFGGAGLLQMPNGRMNRAGEFTFLYSDNEEYRRMALSLQLFPWLETTIRYNDIRTRRYSPFPGFSGDQTYKDRGLDVKLRLLDESLYWPEISVGLRDMAGTGLFAGEYVAASKRWGDFDFTLGMGWGYLGQRDNISNPLCEVSDDFCQRDGGFNDRGGSFETDKWFRGETSVFAGVEYQTPWQPLSVKVEYDGNDYSNDPSGTNIEVDSPVNVGLHYRAADNLNLQLSYERGNTFMFGVNLRMNFNDVSQYKDRPRKRDARDIAQRAASIDAVDSNKLRRDLAKEGGWGAQTISVSEDGTTLTTEGYPGGYRDQLEALDRSSRVLLTTLPESIKEYRFVDKVLGMPLAETRVDAEQLEAQLLQSHLQADDNELMSLHEPSAITSATDNTESGYSLHDNEFKLGWPDFGGRPLLTQSFGNPENFYMYQLRFDLQMDWQLSPNVWVDGTLAFNVLTNYDKFNFLVPGEEQKLPRVRTYIREYVTQSDIWLEKLQATYVKQLHKDWYASVYGGYFERMYAGMGSELLYRPLDKGWAVGVDVNYAKQRSFENHFGMRDYDTVTGHVTGYLKVPYVDDVLLKVAAGRFLAQDVGAQFSVEKKFDSGMIVGAYAARTDVSAEEYGEGSFTKGFYLSIPFDLLQIHDSSGRAAFGWTPLTRDGGQMLYRSRQLYGITEARGRYYSESELYQH